MFKQLSEYARNYIKENIVQLPESNQRLFKLMYGRDNGNRSMEDAIAMEIEEVVNEIPDEKLSWAMEQIDNTLKEKK